VLSDLNQEIDSEFESAGIEIPFPQSDLHLRSIDKDALQALSEPMVKSEKAEKSP
jgi:small-conductance mechanosensitive channel